MADGLYIALSGAVAQETALETTAQNLANANTPGFQRSRAVFSEVLSGETGRAHYMQVSATTIDTTPGALATTGRGLDAALPEGNYLAVSTARGERYTRACHLDVAPDGTLRAGDTPVLSENGTPIKVSRDGGEITLSPEGDVTQDGAVAGRLRLVSFAQPRSLAREGANLLTATAQSGAATAATGVLQVGALEQSNTQTVTAMTDLVTATRQFDAFQRALDAFHDADKKAVNNVPAT